MLAIDGENSLYFVNNCNAPEIIKITQSRVCTTIVPPGLILPAGKTFFPNEYVNRPYVNYPFHFCVNPRGAIIIADPQNHMICKVTHGEPTVIAHKPRLLERITHSFSSHTHQVDEPTHVCSDELGNLYVTDNNGSVYSLIWNESSSYYSFMPIAGSPHTFRQFAHGGSRTVFGRPTSICFKNREICLLDILNDSIFVIDPTGSVRTDATNLGLDGHPPKHLCKDSLGNYFVCYHNTIAKIDRETRRPTPFAGGLYGHQNGFGRETQFQSIAGMCIDTLDNLYVLEPVGPRIRIISRTGIVSTWWQPEVGRQPPVSVQDFNNGPMFALGV